MVILLQDKNCVFTEFGLCTKEYVALIPYDKIIRIIQDHRYQYYEVMFYDQSAKKRKVDISYEIQNETAIFAIFYQKIRYLSERQGHMPFFKAGAIWWILYVIFFIAILTKFFFGSYGDMPSIEVPWIMYPLFLFVNLIPVKNLSLQEMVVFLSVTGLVTFILMCLSYIRSDVTIYEIQ